MSTNATGSHATGSRPTSRGGAPRPSHWRYVVGSLGVAAQGVVALVTLLLGLGWSGWWHSAAVLQAAAGLVAVLWLLVHGRLVLFVVPLLSALATWLFLQAAERHVEQTACGERELAAVGGLRHPAGADPAFRGEMANGCIARFTVPLPPGEVLAHYERALVDAGWAVSRPEPGTVWGSQQGVRLGVSAPEGEGGLVVLTLVDGTTG